MKATNIFYSHFIVWLGSQLDKLPKIKWFFLWYIPIALVAIMFPIWYILDIISNIFDWVCIRVFVWLPLYGMRKMEEMERLML